MHALTISGRGWPFLEQLTHRNRNCEIDRARDSLRGYSAAMLDQNLLPDYKFLLHSLVISATISKIFSTFLSTVTMTR